MQNGSDKELAKTSQEVLIVTECSKQGRHGFFFMLGFIVCETVLRLVSGKMTEILEQGHIFFAFHEQVKFRTTSMSYFFSFFFLSETRQVKG